MSTRIFEWYYRSILEYKWDLSQSWKLPQPLLRPAGAGSDEMGAAIKTFRDELRKMLEGAGPSFMTPIIGPICECGKETHGFANHSDWCDIYKLESNK